MKTIKNLIHALLLWIVNYQINHNLCTHQGKFKKGDFVKYNWKAKIMIDTQVKIRPYPMEIIDITNYRESDGLVFVDREYGGTTGGDAFWFRKVYFLPQIKK